MSRARAARSVNANKAIRAVSRLVLVLLAIAITLAAPVSATTRQLRPVQWQWTDVERIVAIGDIHGAYPSLVSLLWGTGLVSPDLQWIGEDAHLVILGDVLDRGPQSRDALDLIMRLQTEAATDGGRVHMLLGNHELMNLVGDARYISEEEFLAFADEEDPRDREAARQRLARAAKSGDAGSGLAELASTCPPGFFGHSRAFAPDGRYGSWLLEQRALVVINDIAFVHAGLPLCLLDVDADMINPVVMNEIREFVKSRQRLIEVEMLSPELSFSAQLRAANLIIRKIQRINNANPIYRRAELSARNMLELNKGLAFRRDGPFWYRGTALHPDGEEKRRTAKVLARLGARAVVVGHTPVHTGRIATRFGGMVILADTGMLQSHYKGRASAVVGSSAGLFAFYPEEGLSPLPIEILGVVDGLLLADAQLESLLRAANVDGIEDVGSGATRPQRLLLSHQGSSYRAIFKTIDRPSSPETGGNGGDRYHNEIAAYRIDRMLGLGMVPPTVLRTIGTARGSVQLWVENAISEGDRHGEDLEPEDMAAYQRQLSRMQLLDMLILNIDRDDSNILVTTHDWKIHLIDHSHAFGFNLRPLSISGESLDLDDEIVARLLALDARTLRHALGTLLANDQITALLERRDQILHAWEHRNQPLLPATEPTDWQQKAPDDNDNINKDNIKDSGNINDRDNTASN